MRVLIVDDSRATQAIIHRSIERMGVPDIELQKAGDGKTALDIIREWEPNVVISDWHMPTMSGIELLNAVEREMLGIDLGFVTAESSEERLEEAKAHGARFIIQKPFDQDTLEKALQPIFDSHIKKPIESDSSSPASQANKEIILPTLDTLQTKLNTLAKTRVTLTKAPAIIMEKKHFPYLIGLYGNRDKPSVHAIAIADIRTVGILGRFTGEVPKGYIQQALLTHQVSQRILDQGQRALQHVESTLYNMEIEDSLILRDAKLLKSPAEHIQKLLNSNRDHRLDMWVNIAGYKPGCLTIVVS